MAGRTTIPFLVAMMLLTGVCNTLLTKYQDMQCVRDCDTKDPKLFKQPVIQTMQMFIGEAGTWLVVLGTTLFYRFRAHRSGYEALPSGNTHHHLSTSADALAAVVTDTDDARRPAADAPAPSNLTPATKPVAVAGEDGVERIPLAGYKVFLLALPACCDIAGTTLMNVGLLFVAASIYQMTRGALVLFVGMFSVIFLKRHLSVDKWLALFIVVAGVAIVGLAGAIEGHHDVPAAPEADDVSFSDGMRTLIMRSIASLQEPEVAPIDESAVAVRVVIGVLLIAVAQIFTASQFVLEESIMQKYAMAPIKVVGWEGIFGLSVTIIGMIVLHLAVGQTDAGRYGYFDAKEGLREFFGIRSIALSSIFIMISIGGFNFFGLSVTRSVSATSRSTIDTCRTLFIWIASLGLGWESFKWLQVLGFVLLVYGTFLFNDVVRSPLKRWWGARGSGEAPLLREDEDVEGL